MRDDVIGDIGMVGARSLGGWVVVADGGPLTPPRLGHFRCRNAHLSPTRERRRIGLRVIRCFNDNLVWS